MLTDKEKQDIKNRHGEEAGEKIIARYDRAAYLRKGADAVKESTAVILDVHRLAGRDILQPESLLARIIGLENVVATLMPQPKGEAAQAQTE